MHAVFEQGLMTPLTLKAVLQHSPQRPVPISHKAPVPEHADPFERRPVKEKIGRTDNRISAAECLA